MLDPAQTVVEFIDRYNACRFDEAISLLDENVFYHNIPMDPIIGRDSFRKFNDHTVVKGRLTPAWTLKGIAAKGELVLTERVDDFITPDGGRVSIPLMGSFVVRGGLIAEWRDYFDLANFQRQFQALGPQQD